MSAPRAQYHLPHCSLTHALGDRLSTRRPPWLLLFVYVILAVGLHRFVLLFVDGRCGLWFRCSSACSLRSGLQALARFSGDDTVVTGRWSRDPLADLRGLRLRLCEGGLHENWQVWMGTLS